MKLSPCAESRTAKVWSECFHCIHRALQGWKWNSKAARVAQNSIISAPEKVRKRQLSESDSCCGASVSDAIGVSQKRPTISSLTTCQSRKSANDLRGCIGAA